MLFRWPNPPPLISGTRFWGLRAGCSCSTRHWPMLVGAVAEDGRDTQQIWTCYAYASIQSYFTKYIEIINRYQLLPRRGVTALPRAHCLCQGRSTSRMPESMHMPMMRRSPPPPSSLSQCYCHQSIPKQMVDRRCSITCITPRSCAGTLGTRTLAYVLVVVCSLLVQLPSPALFVTQRISTR